MTGDQTSTSEASGPGTGPARPSTARGPNRLVLFAVIVFIVAASIAVAVLVAGGDGGGPETHSFTVPQGAFERVRDGEDLEIIPRELHVSVGDKIRIVNQDNVGQTIGPYYVPAGQTVEQTFREETTLEGLCTAHPEGQIRIVVGDGNPEPAT